MFNHKKTIEICNEQCYIETLVIAFKFVSVTYQDTLRQCSSFDLSLSLPHDPWTRSPKLWLHVSEKEEISEKAI